MTIWTIEKIQGLPWSGDWFYGIVKDEGIRVGEIFPGLGYTSIWKKDLLRPKNLWWIVSDIIRS